jgi:hypothetical protein
MADSLAIVANGSTFLRGDSGSPEVYTAVAEVSDIVPGAGTAPDIDVSHLLSTAREKRGGLPDFGEMSVTMNLLPGNTTQEAMEDEAGLNIVRHYRIMHPDQIKGRQFTLILKTFGTTGYVVDGKIQAIATFAVSGKPTRVG